MHIVLVAPEIPQNTGNIGRLCVATNSKLHLVEPLGFEISNKQLRRAGLDYWKHVQLQRHASWEAFLEQQKLLESGSDEKSLFLLTTKAEKLHTAVTYQPNSYLVLGSESKGLPLEIHEQFSEQRIKIPMYSDHIRSLNIANAASIVLYESIRQQQLKGVLTR